jgi:dTDP-4-dehydrorhamnose 3,5-epimerase
VLEDGTETSYQVGEFYAPASEGGLRYDDPRLGIQWALPVSEMSEKDSSWERLDAIEEDLRRRMYV